MIRFLHTADLHLDSKLNTRLDERRLKIRRNELSAVPERIAQKAKELSCRAVLLCGDVFDRAKPTETSMRRFKKVLEDYPDLDFLLLLGNHDGGISPSRFADWNCPNLKLFPKKGWGSYDYPEVSVSGTEDLESATVEKLPQRSGTHIVMLHGEIRDGMAMQKDTIPVGRFRGKGIDYLALGHYHSYAEQALDQRGVCVYSGCPEGRGMDETGEKGVVLIEVDQGRVSHRFIPMAQRQIFDLELHVDEQDAFEDVREKVGQTVSGISQDSIVRVRLTGRSGDRTSLYPEILDADLNEKFFFAWTENKTVCSAGAGDEDEVSVRSEFIRTVREDTALSDEEKEAVLQYGLAALNKDRHTFEVIL